MRRVLPKRQKRFSNGRRRTRSPNEDKYQNKGGGNWRQKSKAFLTTGGTIPVKRQSRRNGVLKVWYEFYRPCAHCGERPGTHCDHRLNAAIHDVDFWDQSNWQPLCPSCHGRKSLKERNQKNLRNKGRGETIP